MDMRDKPLREVQQVPPGDYIVTPEQALMMGAKWVPGIMPPIDTARVYARDQPVWQTGAELLSIVYGFTVSEVQ